MGRAIVGTAALSNPGELESTHATGIDKITWQPRSGVRIATVSVPWSGGTVTAGRSLQVVAEHETEVETLVAIGWLSTLAALAVSSILVGWIWSGSQSRDDGKRAKRTPVADHVVAICAP